MIIDLLRSLYTIQVANGGSLWLRYLQEANPDEWKLYDDYILEYLGIIVPILNDTATTEFLQSTITEAAEFNMDDAWDGDRIWLAREVAFWLYKHGLHIEDSTMLFEKIILRLDSMDESTQQAWIPTRTKAAEHASRIYYDKAMAALKDHEDFLAHITKLETLARTREQRGEKTFFRATRSALFLGKWRREQEGETSNWKVCIKPWIQAAFYLLSDDDPLNDQDAYVQLGEALLSAGDLLNAQIAFGIATAPLEGKSEVVTLEERSPIPSDHGTDLESQELKDHLPGYEPDQSQGTYEAVAGGEGRHRARDDNVATEDPVQSGHGTQPDEVLTERAELLRLDSSDGANPQQKEEMQGLENNEDLEDEPANPKYTGFHRVWTCNGPCDTPESGLGELFVCSVCLDVFLCSKCLDLLKTQETPFRYCSNAHDHLRIFPLGREAKVMTDALMEQRFEVQQEWLDGLKKVWEAV